MSDFKPYISGISDFIQDQDTGGYSVNPPLTQTALSHSIAIRTENGIKIGRIQSWSPSMSRVVDQIFEVQSDNTGEMVEQVPQIQNSNTISVDRYEMYNSKMGQAFNIPSIRSDRDMIMLTDQYKPIRIREIWRDPFGIMQAYEYIGVYFSDIGITISATDDRIIKAKGTLQFTRKVRLV